MVTRHGVLDTFLLLHRRPDRGQDTNAGLIDDLKLTPQHADSYQTFLPNLATKFVRYYRISISNSSVSLYRVSGVPCRSIRIRFANARLQGFQ
jgi:hypothetical protein